MSYLEQLAWEKDHPHESNNSPLDSFNPEDYDDNSDPKESQVDFEMLKSFIRDLKYNGTFSFSPKGQQNLQLFFKLLSTKPTFGKVAYRELNKLNK